MVWDIHVSTTRHDDRSVLVKARWTALGSIDDVSLDCGPGVHPIGVEDLGRREMNAFSKPLKGAFRWDDGVQDPRVFLTWCDTGETCERIIGLDQEDHDSRPWSRHRSAGLRTLLHRAYVTTALSASTAREPDARLATARRSPVLAPGRPRSPETR
jgi:hypothetical protein